MSVSYRETGGNAAGRRSRSGDATWDLPDTTCAAWSTAQVDGYEMSSAGGKLGRQSGFSQADVGTRVDQPGLRLRQSYSNPVCPLTRMLPGGCRENR